MSTWSFAPCRGDDYFLIYYGLSRRRDSKASNRHLFLLVCIRVTNIACSPTPILSEHKHWAPGTALSSQSQALAWCFVVLLHPNTTTTSPSSCFVFILHSPKSCSRAPRLPGESCGQVVTSFVCLYRLFCMSTCSGSELSSFG